MSTRLQRRLSVAARLPRRGRGDGQGRRQWSDRDACILSMHCYVRIRPFVSFDLGVQSLNLIAHPASGFFEIQDYRGRNDTGRRRDRHANIRRCVKEKTQDLGDRQCKGEADGNPEGKLRFVFSGHAITIWGVRAARLSGLLRARLARVW